MVDGNDFLLWYSAAGTAAQPTLDSLHLDFTTLAAIQAPTPTPEPASLLLPRRRPPKSQS